MFHRGVCATKIATEFKKHLKSITDPFKNSTAVLKSESKLADRLVTSNRIQNITKKSEFSLRKYTNNNTTSSKILEKCSIWCWEQISLPIRFSVLIYTLTFLFNIMKKGKLNNLIKAGFVGRVHKKIIWSHTTIILTWRRFSYHLSLKLKFVLFYYEQTVIHHEIFIRETN